MKNSSEEHANEMKRDTALGLLAANMAVPGTGTFLAGRRVLGAVQIILALAGLAVTTILGLKMAVWMLANWDQLHDPYGDPVESLAAIWNVSKWPLAGIAAFAISWVWSVLGSLRPISAAKRAANSGAARLS